MIAQSKIGSIISSECLNPLKKDKKTERDTFSLQEKLKKFNIWVKNTVINGKKSNPITFTKQFLLNEP